MTGRCGATNPTLGLRCDREPHSAGTAHYQDDGNGVHAWHEPYCVHCHPAPGTFRCRELGHTIRRTDRAAGAVAGATPTTHRLTRRNP